MAINLRVGMDEVDIALLETRKFAAKLAVKRSGSSSISETIKEMELINDFLTKDMIIRNLK